MKPVTQTQTGVGNLRANCLMAAVASILEVELDTLPDIYEAEQRGLAWFVALKDALLPLGVVPVRYDQASDHFPQIAPDGYHIACGKSPRSNESHAVVAKDGFIVHDPHPSRAGIDGAIGWWILLMPAAWKALPERAAVSVAEHQEGSRG
jgi:hypothetical protein